MTYTMHTDNSCSVHLQQDINTTNHQRPAKSPVNCHTWTCPFDCLINRPWLSNEPPESCHPALQFCCFIQKTAHLLVASVSELFAAAPHCAWPFARTRAKLATNWYGISTIQDFYCPTQPCVDDTSWPHPRGEKNKGEILLFKFLGSEQIKHGWQTAPLILQSYVWVKRHGLHLQPGSYI